MGCCFIGLHCLSLADSAVQQIVQQIAQQSVQQIVQQRVQQSVQPIVQLIVCIVCVWPTVLCNNWQSQTRETFGQARRRY